MTASIKKEEKQNSTCLQEKLNATTINFAKGIKPDLTKPLGLTVIF